MQHCPSTCHPPSDHVGRRRRWLVHHVRSRVPVAHRASSHGDGRRRLLGYQSFDSTRGPGLSASRPRRAGAADRWGNESDDAVQPDGDRDEDSISAPSPQGQYEFASWSDGAIAHDIFANASATYTATCRTAAVISNLTKTVSPPGSIVTWTLSVSNNGPLDATGIVVTDVLPSRLTSPTFTTPGCAYEAQRTIRCTAARSPAEPTHRSGSRRASRARVTVGSRTPRGSRTDSRQQYREQHGQRQSQALNDRRRGGSRRPSAAL